MGADRHIIHRLVLDIEAPDKAMADQASNRIVHLLHHDLLPKLEKYLDELEVSHHFLIDKLALDLGKMRTDQLEGFSEKLIEAIHEAMETPETRKNVQTGQLLSQGDKAFHTFIYFLETGKLPWHTYAGKDWLSDELIWLELLKEPLSEASGRIILQNLLFQSPAAFHRLLSQFTPFFSSRVIEKLKGRSEGSLQVTVKTIFNRFIQRIKSSGAAEDSAENTEYVQFERLAFILAFYDQLTDDGAHAVRIITELSAGKDNIAAAIKKIKPGEGRSGKQEPARDESAHGGLFIQNAGLVILHPFLHYFFMDFGLVAENGFTDEPARQLAVHLLHYLATGKTEPAEYDLSFEKFLCNWPEEQPVERFIAIPQRMCDEADHLLKAAIGHWKVLKNTSPDGLREGFLTRAGKLVTTGEPTILYVEKNTIDVLLSSLPWGLGVIKLPWMPEPFYVDWQ